VHDSGTAIRPPHRDPHDAARRRRWSLRNLRLRKRLILLVLVPLVAGVALASARVVSEAGTIRSENDLNGQARVALSLAGLVYSVEDERDAVEVYLTDGGQPADLAALERAESVTQTRIGAFQAAELAQAGALGMLAPSVQVLEQQAVARLGDLPTLRASVTSLGAGRPIYQAYTTIVGELLDFSGQLSTDTTDHDLASFVSTLSLVEQVGEQTSQERGYLVGILGGGGQSAAEQDDLIQAQAQYTATVADIDAQAPASIVDLYQANVGGDATGAADSTVQQAIDAALQDTPVSQIAVSDTTAFAETSAKVNQIRAIEAVVGQDILDRASALLASARDALYQNVGIIVAVLLLAFFATVFIARSITRPLMVLRTSALDIATVRLPAVIERLRDPAQAEAGIDVRPIAIETADEIGSVARAFDEVHHAAVRLASEQALLRSSVNAVFTNLSRRSQTLVERQLQLIDDLESGEGEPSRLAALFRLDHLATRMRRNNENLLVLAGEETARRWTEAVRLVDVARAAAAEVEQYERIILGEVPRVAIAGKAAPDVAHLVAELLENATAFSAPRTKVWIAARPAEDGGVLLRIEDAGIGMKRAELEEANDRINHPPVVDVSVARRMGLYVVGRLAARYGIEVRLGESQVGGVAALIHLPAELLSPTAGLPLPGHSQVDDEFYALSRQFEHGAAQASSTGSVAAALLGDAQGASMGVPVAPHTPWRQEPGARPDPPPWYDPRLLAHPVAPEQPAAGTVWFQPSEDRAEPGPGPQPVSAPALGGQRGQADPAAPPTAERTPIFEAMESEWFRRREQARAAAGAPPLPVPTASPAGAPPAVAAPSPAAAVRRWSSPGDDGWRAAQALADPAHDGQTRSGLPRRTPRANLVPGRAGGTGAAPAAPPRLRPNPSRSGQA
jgi:signal transduction histidine kinase